MNLLERIGYTPETFRDAVKKFRAEGGLTREQMANYLGCVTVSTIYKWERDGVTPRNKAVISRLIQMKVIQGAV